MQPNSPTATGPDWCDTNQVKLVTLSVQFAVTGKKWNLVYNLTELLILQSNTQCRITKYFVQYDFRNLKLAHPAGSVTHP